MTLFTLIKKKFSCAETCTFVDKPYFFSLPLLGTGMTGLVHQFAYNGLYQANTLKQNSSWKEHISCIS